MKPYLAIFRSGASSLHPHAVDGCSALNFDYALSHFADNMPPSDHAAFVDHQKGPKWQGLFATIKKHWDTIRQYEYVWLPDDDLLCDPKNVARLFAITADLKLDMSQPALTHDSYFSHVVTLQHKAFQVRFTNFVEIMAPLVSTRFLERILPDFKNTISGYGLDALWPRYSRLGKLAIIDETPIKHTRPVGGANYAHNKNAGLPPQIEDYIVSALQFIEQPTDFHINFAGLLKNGKPISIGDSHFEVNNVLTKLIESLAGDAKIDAVQLTRYLSNHLQFCTGEAFGRLRYPRSAIRLVLNQELMGSGIEFPDPTKSTENSPTD